MIRRLFVPLILVAASLAWAAWPPGPWEQDPNFRADVDAGYCHRQLLVYTALLPVRVQQDLADAGFPITVTARPYKRLAGREWVCSFPDGGGFTALPRLPRAAEHFRPDLATVASPGCFADGGSLCTSGDDGGEAVSPLREIAFECACSSGSLCTGLPPDGGARQAAPTGFTLPGAGWTAPSGSGCVPKSCGELWLQFSDGGRPLSSWPAACPGGP